MKKKMKRRVTLYNVVVVGLAALLLAVSGVFLWVASLEIPTLDGFESRQMTQSTRIYDRTGEVLLFNLHEEVRRSVVPLEDISRNIRNATIAIEDATFYEHPGIRVDRTLKAIYDNIVTGELLGGQGGSTITQQVVKNTLLTNDKTITRKVKEWILALKMEQMLTKDQILELYLNEVPYGGNIYGAEEAAKHFFGVSASDVSIAQAAYLAALPQAPSRYSPYGNNIELLEARKELVLRNMVERGYITQAEYESALAEEVVFEQYGDTNIKAPHFVFYVREYLEAQFGRDAVYTEGLRVITTLDYEMQQIAEAVVKEYAFQNEIDFNAENAALVAIDPNTGQILAMVGSRDYFDPDIDGKFNVATSYNRQPGSTFKPIVYATAFEMGYTPETVVFDVPTQFSARCEPDNFTSEDGCYSPVNYDNEFRGPMTFRSALAQSINIPAVKALHLVGVDRALETAERLGITSLDEGANFYGLPLVLGGGEVSPLELTSAYATLANNGYRHPHTSILRVEDAAGTVLEEFRADGFQAIDEQAARLVNDILHDIDARTPAYGANSFSFGSQQVGVKTGTTNDFNDVWIMGYTPNLAVGTWAGNNDSSPIVKQVAGFVIAPLWREFMDQALPLVEAENFEPPLAESDPESLKPVLRGFWQGSTGDDGSVPRVHSILHWVERSDPRGPFPARPESDPQYLLWEYAVAAWAQENVPQLASEALGLPVSNGSQQHHTRSPFTITTPQTGASVSRGQLLHVRVQQPQGSPLTSVEYYLNNAFMGSVGEYPFSLSVVPQTVGSHTIRAVGHAGMGAVYEAQVTFIAQ